MCLIDELVAIRQVFESCRIACVWCRCRGLTCRLGDLVDPVCTDQWKRESDDGHVLFLLCGLAGRRECSERGGDHGDERAGEQERGDGDRGLRGVHFMSFWWVFDRYGLLSG